MIRKPFLETLPLSKCDSGGMWTTYQPPMGHFVSFQCSLLQAAIFVLRLTIISAVKSSHGGTLDEELGYTGDI